MLLGCQTLPLQYLDVLNKQNVATRARSPHLTLFKAAVNEH
jgi:hypothetical protein